MSNNLGQLPEEILLRILQHVNNHYEYALINKRFYSVANPLLWRYPSVNDSQLPKFIKTLTNSQHRLGQYVRRLDRISCWTNASLLSVLKHVKNLETLRLDSRSKVTDKSLSYLSQRCSNLKTLNLQYIPISHKTMMAIGQHCHQLRNLTLTSNSLSANTLSAFVNCPVEKLTLTEDSFDDGPRWMTVQETLVDLMRFNSLTSLSLTNVTHEFIQHLLTATGATPSGNDTPWPHLTNFFINSTTEVGDAPMIAFLKTHPRINDLCLYSCDLSDTTLDTISTCLPGLTSLDLYDNPRITAEAVRQVVLNCPLLTFVNLEECEIWSTGLLELFEGEDDGEHGYLDCLDEEYIDIIRRFAQKG